MVATAIVSSPRSKSIATMIFRRSTRSVMTPAGSVKSNHGSLPTNPARAMRKGSRVIAEANQGYAINEIPSPRFEIAVADQSRQ